MLHLKLIFIFIGYIIINSKRFEREQEKDGTFTFLNPRKSNQCKKIKND